MNKQDNPYKLIESKTIYKNPWIGLREDKVLRPEGKEGIFGVVSVGAGVSILPIDEEGNTYLIQEYQYAADKDTLLTVSGDIDEEEDPLTAAKRELKEEAGIEANEWTSLGTVESMTMLVDCTMHLFLARGLTVGVVEDDPTIKLVKLPFSQAVQLALSGEIAPAAPNVLILRADHFLRNQ